MNGPPPAQSADEAPAPHSPVVALFWITFALALAHLAWQYRALPETVASHFDAAGRADGWSPKPTYLTFLAVVYVCVTALFLGVRATMRRMPGHQLNVPNRAYWLAPEREATTRERLSRSTLWLGWATLVLLIAVAHLSFQANHTPERSMGYAPWIALGCYTAFSLGWMVRLLHRFLRPPS